MNLIVPCARCGKALEIGDELAGRKIRCQSCGQLQRVPSAAAGAANRKPPAAPDVYPLASLPPSFAPESNPGRPQPSWNAPIPREGRAPARKKWHQLVRAGARESSVLEAESLALIALSAADLLVTYALLRRGPAFYESNPVAQWFFARWNIAGMAIFKFSAMGLVVVIGEIVERHRPRWGRGVVLVSCLATAAVIWHGLRLLVGHADNGALLD